MCVCMCACVLHSWGGCTRACGSGSKTRRRTITRKVGPQASAYYQYMHTRNRHIIFRHRLTGRILAGRILACHILAGHILAGLIELLPSSVAYDSNHNVCNDTVIDTAACVRRQDVPGPHSQHFLQHPEMPDQLCRIWLGRLGRLQQGLRWWHASPHTEHHPKKRIWRRRLPSHENEQEVQRAGTPHANDPVAVCA